MVPHDGPRADAGHRRALDTRRLAWQRDPTMALRLFPGLLLAVMAPTALAHADTGAPLDDEGFTWVAPPACPGRATALARARAASPAGVTGLRVMARVTEDAGGYLLALDLSKAGRASIHREARSSSCDELADAAAAMLTVWAEDPASPAGPSPSARSPRAADPGRAPGRRGMPPPVEERRGAERADHTPPAPRAERLWLGADLAVDAGTLPVANAGGGLRAAVSRGALRVELGAMAWWPREAASGTVRGAGIALSPFTGSADLCLTLGGASLGWGACAGASIAHVVGRGYGAPRVAEGAATWLAPTATLYARVALSGAAGVFLRLQGALPTGGAELVLEEIGSVRAGASAGVRASIGVERDFL